MWIFSVFVLIWNEEEEETGRWAAVKAFVEWCFLFLFSKRHNPVEDTTLRTLFHPNRIRFHFACISRTSIDTHLFGFAWLYSLFFSLFFFSHLYSFLLKYARFGSLFCHVYRFSFWYVSILCWCCNMLRQIMSSVTYLYICISLPFVCSTLLSLWIVYVSISIFPFSPVYRHRCYRIVFVWNWQEIRTFMFFQYNWLVYICALFTIHWTHCQLKWIF